MLTILLIFAALVLFAVGLFSPHRSKRVAHAAHKKLKPWEERAEKLPVPLNYLAKGPVWSSRKVAEKSTEKGREAREKLKK